MQVRKPAKPRYPGKNRTWPGNDPASALLPKTGFSKSARKHIFSFFGQQPIISSTKPEHHADH